MNVKNVQPAGTMEFKSKGVFNFTIRPADWYLKPEEVFVNIKNIKLIPEQNQK